MAPLSGKLVRQGRRFLSASAVSSFNQLVLPIHGCPRGGPSDSSADIQDGLRKIRVRHVHLSLPGITDQTPTSRDTMADSTDWRQTRSAEEAAADTEEPAEAARVRAQDDAEAKARLDEAAARLGEANRALDAGEARLRLTAAELRRREEELEQTSNLARQVAESAKELRQQTRQIVDEARRAGPGSENR